jgi:hypothetical protein
VAERPREQRARLLNAERRLLPVLVDLEARDALDQHTEAAADVQELKALVPADEAARDREVGVGDVDGHARQARGGEIAAAFRLGPILGRLPLGLVPARLSFALALSVVEVLLQRRALAEDSLEQKLELVRIRALELGAVELPPEQLELGRVAHERRLQRIGLALERRDDRTQRRDDLIAVDPGNSRDPEPAARAGASDAVRVLSAFLDEWYNDERLHSVNGHASRSATEARGHQKSRQPSLRVRQKRSILPRAGASYGLACSRVTPRRSDPSRRPSPR